MGQGLGFYNHEGSQVFLQTWRVHVTYLTNVGHMSQSAQGI